ncbi:uncharacterized protein LOC142972642 isoform X2 [Anticarsia gemmatalis]
MVYLHCLMFMAGALVVSVYSRFNDIVYVSKQKLEVFLNNANVQRLQEYLKITAVEAMNIAISLYHKIWEKIKTCACDANCAFHAFRLKVSQKQRINQMLLKKIRDIGEEKRNLAQLLLAAIHENKNIRVQYQLENMAKNRLVRHIENTQKVIKENRSRYVSFQQLYLVTHQENSFLKYRIKKLTKDKEEAEKNLLELMNEVYKSKNNDLKAYCSRFIVQTKENFLKSDIGAEIQKFINNSRVPISTSNWKITERPVIEVNTANSWLKCSSCSQITEITEDGAIAPLVSEAPKLKGLPGECVWTVKDKDGLIEKLYEYDCQTDLHNGDTIRRIREYSVYYDKDCLLDFSSSSTVIDEARTSHSGMWSNYTDQNCQLTNQRFLTGSAAFQKFMLNNKNIVSTSILPSSPLSLD